MKHYCYTCVHVGKTSLCHGIERVQLLFVSSASEVYSTKSEQRTCDACVYMYACANVSSSPEY